MASLIKTVGVFIVLFLIIGAVYGDQAQAADKVKFSLDWVIYGKHIGFYPAFEKGFYKDSSLDVTMTRGYGSGDTIKRIAAGTDDVGLADMGSLVIARSKGAMVKGISIFHDENLAALYVLKDSGIKTPKDLAGKRFGAPVGNAVRVVFPAFAAANGIDPAKATWIDMAGEAQLPSLLAGRIDVAPMFATEAPTIRAAAAKEGKEIVEIKYSKWGLDIYSVGLIATDKLVKENPDLLKRFVHATMKGLAWAIENAEEAQQMFSKQNPAISPGLARQHWQIAIEHLLTPTAKENGIGYMIADKMKLTRDLITKYNNLEVVVPVEDLYTNQFLPKIFPKR